MCSIFFEMSSIKLRIEYDGFMILIKQCENTIMIIFQGIKNVSK